MALTYRQSFNGIQSKNTNCKSKDSYRKCMYCKSMVQSVYKERWQPIPVKNVALTKSFLFGIVSEKLYNLVWFCKNSMLAPFTWHCGALLNYNYLYSKCTHLFYWLCSNRNYTPYPFIEWVKQESTCPHCFFISFFLFWIDKISWDPLGFI